MSRTKQRNEHHITGYKGQRIVEDLLPDQWVYRVPIPDYGIDLHVELFEPSQEDPRSANTLAEYIFLQVKTVARFKPKEIRVDARGRITRKKSATGEVATVDVVSHKLEVEELRTIESMGPAAAALLVLVDLSSGEARYLCLNDWISKVLLPAKPDYEETQKTVTVHVPLTNTLDSTDHNFWYIRLLARRAKLYAAFNVFSYQENELNYMLDAISMRQDNGLSLSEAMAAVELNTKMSSFIRDNLRLAIWHDLGEATWFPLTDLHERFMELGSLIEAYDSSDRASWEIQMSALATFRQAALLGRLFEEVCREWHLPTLAAQQLRAHEG